MEPTPEAVFDGWLASIASPLASDSQLRDEAAAKLGERLSELRPYVDEYLHLKRVLAVINDPRAARPTNAGGRKRHPGVTAQSVLRLVRINPGITRSDIAARVSTSLGEADRALAELRARGLVVERGGSYYALRRQAPSADAPSPRR
jgi:hypothetical protein